MTRTRSLFLSLIAGFAGAVMFLQPVPAADALDTPATSADLAAAPAFKDTAGPVLAVAPPSIWTTVVLPGFVRIVSDPAFLGILGALLMYWLRQKNAARAAVVEKAVDAAFGIVEDLKKAGKLPAGVAKGEVALGKFHELLEAQGVTATGLEIQLAQAAWSAAHGTQAAPVVAPVAPVVPTP